MAQPAEDMESTIGEPSQSRSEQLKALSARSDEGVAGYDSLTPIEVRTADGRVLHTSLAKLDELMASLRAERGGKV